MLVVTLLALAGIAMATSIREVLTVNDGGLNGFSYPRMLDDDTVICQGYSPNDVTGVYYVTEPHKPVAVVTTDSHIVPESFNRFSGLHLGRNGRLRASQPSIVVIGSIEDEAGSGIFAYSKGDLETLADHETLIPDGPGCVFEKFQYSSMSHDGSVIAFYGSCQHNEWAGIYYQEGTGGELKRAVDFQTKIPGLESYHFDYFASAIVSNTHIVFFGSLQADSDARKAAPGIYLFEMATQEVSVIIDTLMGDNENPDDLFVAFSDPDFDGECAAFVGKKASGLFGVYLYSLKSKTLTRIVDTESSDLKSFPQVPSVWGHSVAFLAVDKDSKNGIYAWKHGSGMHKVVAVGDKTLPVDDGKSNPEVHYLGIAGGALRDDKLAFYSVRSGDSEKGATAGAGLYIATLSFEKVRDEL